MAINYCRREINLRENSRLCMNKITTPNALEWCDSCRERLPLWPADDAAEHMIYHPAVQSQEVA